MLKMFKKRQFVISGRVLINVIFLLVSMAWMIQLVFHQTWRCIVPQFPWFFGFIISLFISLIPLIPTILILHKKIDIPVVKITLSDVMFIFFIALLAWLFWYVYARPASYFPVHLYGDESFHYSRVNLMVNDFQKWLGFLSRRLVLPPDFQSEYMMYPALAYVPVTIWTTLFSNPAQIADQRIFLFVQYLSVVICTWIFAKSVIKSRMMCMLIAFLPLTSALLVSYTMSFYIEIHYVSLLLIACAFLAWGIQKQSQYIIICAVFMASLAPIIRESALPSTVGIVFAASLWYYFQYKNKARVIGLIFSAGYFLAALIPFFFYYIAKSNYTNFDKNRLSIRFIFQQDYLHLFQYSFLYLGPIFWGAIIFFILFPLEIKKQKYLFLSAIISLLGSLVMQSIFVPGYMPWSRNYLFYYAASVVLTVLAISAFMNKYDKKKWLIILIYLGIMINYIFLEKYLFDDRFFNESEMVFDLRPINKYLISSKLTAKKIDIYIVWPKGYPTYPDNQLPSQVNLVKIEAKHLDTFPSFALVSHLLPEKAHYFLFYYMKNESAPSAFNHIPSISRPSPLPDGYRMLSENTDPWSRRNNGVMLIEKKLFSNKNATDVMKPKKFLAS